MPANTAPIFIAVPQVGFARITAANTARDGSGTLNDAFLAAANGSIVTRITFTSAQATAGAAAAKVFRVFITDTTGANPRLYREVAASAVTASNTAIGQAVQLVIQDALILKSGQKIQVCQSVYASAADQTDVVVEGGDY